MKAARSALRARSLSVCVRHVPAGWDHRFHKRPLGIGQIAQVTNVIALCGTAVFRFPHRALPKESSAKQGITSDWGPGSPRSPQERVPASCLPVNGEGTWEWLSRISSSALNERCEKALGNLAFCKIVDETVPMKGTVTLIGNLQAK